jgi:hypothetical protein
MHNTEYRTIRDVSRRYIHYKSEERRISAIYSDIGDLTAALGARRENKAAGIRRGLIAGL